MKGVIVIEILFVIFLPNLFLIALFTDEEHLRRENVNQNGMLPIDRTLFLHQ